MESADRPARWTSERLLAWAPLFLGTINSYGPVAFNYGFALYFLNYDHGFVKRGLIGEAVLPIRWLPRGRLLIVEYLFLAAAYALTYAVFRPLLFGPPEKRRLAAALLSAPALLPHLGYLFEQPDVILYILVLGCVWLFLSCRPGTAAAGSCVLCCAGVLVHEAFCLMFYPLIVAILWRLAAQKRLPWGAVLAHVAVVAAVFAAVMHWGVLRVSPDTILAEAQARTDVGIQRQVYDVMASSFAEQEALVRRMYTPDVLRVLAITIVLSAPYVWLLGTLLNRAMRSMGWGAGQRRAVIAMFCSPVLLCAVGHDTTRWIGAGCMEATLFLLFVLMDKAEQSKTLQALEPWASSGSYLAWLVYLVGIGPFGATGLRAAQQLVSAWRGP